ncbi:MAG: transposase [Phycisphaeraceae bacterium]|nr:transposase [Phycisphaeraceae bacterium]
MSRASLSEWRTRYGKIICPWKRCFRKRAKADFNREGLGIGPDYIGYKLEKWSEKHKITLMFTQPRNPQQNAYVDRYNRTVRNDWLSQYIFKTTE